VADRKHAYECGGKSCAKMGWNEWIMDGQSWPSNKSLEKNKKIHPFWSKQKSWTIWDYDQEQYSIIWYNPYF
jgi:hypothetical protein